MWFFTTAGYLICMILYSWSTPSWFAYFPYGYAFRFIIAIALYFLCSALFCALSTFSAMIGYTNVFKRIFIASFFPIPFFVTFILLNFPLQDILFGICLVDVVSVLFVTGFLWYAMVHFKQDTAMRNLYRVWMIYAGAQFLAVYANTAISISGALIGILRLLLLALTIILTIRIWPSNAIDTCVSDVAKRYRLSPRETDILTLLHEGKNNEEIAATLFISLSTVKTHIANIFMKTGSKNRVQAALLYIKE